MDPAAYFALLADVQARLPFADIVRLAEIMLAAQRGGRTVFVFGNGGSAALSAHVVCDLAKGIRRAGQPGLRIAALTDNMPLVSAWANDADYSRVFAEQIDVWGQPGDVAWAVSCSGNSPNVLRALECARDLRMTCVGLGGYQGGRMRALCDLCVIVPSDHMQVIEDLHHAIAHAVFLRVRAAVQAAAPSPFVAAGGR